MSQSHRQHELEKRLAESWPVREWCDSHVLLGVSGGPDSVAMLRGVISLKVTCGGTGKLYVAHLNHQMRGTAADEDEAWVRILCERFGVQLAVERTDIAAIAAEQRDGWEAAARNARYDFLRRTAERLGARFVAIAHTADDQVETVLHRIIRGTGIDGLAGMAQVRALSPSVALVRPLLAVWRSEVLAYLAAIGQEHRTDVSNENVRFTRNRLRHELLPQLRDVYNAKVDAALLRLAAQANEAQQLIAGLAADVARDCMTICNASVRIDCERLTGESPIVVREVCRVAWSQAGWPEQSMGFEQWQLLAACATGKLLEMINLPGNIRARREGGILVLDRFA